MALDLELNGESNEIIQIGMCAFDTDGGASILDLYVDCPTLNLDQMLNNGKTLRAYLHPKFAKKYDVLKISKHDAETELNHFLSNTEGRSCVVQWGSADYRLLTEQFNTVFRRPDLINVQKLYKRLYAPAQGLPRTGGLKQTASLLKLQGHTPHDAVSDAWVTGEIFIQMFDDLRAVSKIKKVLSDVD